MTWTAAPTFSISPAFPTGATGATVNYNTGVVSVDVSGTPSASSAATDYRFTVTAGSVALDGGTLTIPTSTSFDVTATVADVIATASPTGVSFTKSVTISPSEIVTVSVPSGTWNAGTVMLSQGSAAITSGDSTVGSIRGITVSQDVSGANARFTFSGTPTDSLTSTDLTVTGGVGTGSATATFKIEIIDNAVTVTPSSLTFVKGTAPTANNVVTASLDIGTWDNNSVSLYVTGEATAVVSADASTGTWNGMTVTKNTATTGRVAFTFTEAPTNTLNARIFTISGTTGGVSVSKTFTVTVSDTPATPEPIGTVLSEVNSSIAPNSVSAIATLPAATVAEMINKGITTTTPITSLLSSGISRKAVPSLTRPAGFGSAASTTTVSIPLNTTTTGNALALAYTVSVAGISGLAGWESMTNDQRLALLATDFMFSYEYPATWSNLVGGSALVTWQNALAQGIVSFTNTGITINYVAVDAASLSPFVAGSMIVIPDGNKNNTISDPVWLMSRMNAPATGLVITPKPTRISVGQSVIVTAVFTPANPESRELIWATSDAIVAGKPTRIGTTDTYSIQGLTRGIVDFTAVVDGNTSVSDGFTVTVGNNYDDDDDGGSSGCSAFGPAAAALAGALFLLRKRSR